MLVTYTELIFPLSIELWQMIIYHFFEHPARLFQQNISWSSFSVSDQLSMIFTLSDLEQYGTLLASSRGIRELLRGVCKCKFGERIDTGMIWERSQLILDVYNVRSIVTYYLKEERESLTLHDVNVMKQYMEVFPARTFEIIGSKRHGNDFLARLSVSLIYNAIALLFYDATNRKNEKSVQFSTDLGMLLICGFSRDGDGRYIDGGVENKDDSIVLVLLVLKRIFWRCKGDFLPGWKWTAAVSRLFKYPPHVSKWKELDGFSVFYYMMLKHKNHTTLLLLSDYIFTAASNTTVRFVDLSEFGKLLTELMEHVASLWQPNKCDNQVILKLKSLTRLFAVLRLQYPLDLHPPDSLILEKLINSPCCLERMESTTFNRPLQPLDLAAKKLLQDKAGYVFPFSYNDNTAWTLVTFDDILRTGDCIGSTMMYLQVFNSFLLWLISCYPASELHKHGTKIGYRMESWGCRYDRRGMPPYVVKLKETLWGKGRAI